MGTFREKSTYIPQCKIPMGFSICKPVTRFNTIQEEIGDNNISKQVDHHDLPQVESIGNRCNSLPKDIEMQDEHASEENLSNSSIDEM